jgi:hypothetical protein
MMDTTVKDNGGFAYPQTPAMSPMGDIIHPSEQGWGGGMSLRDYFAAQALTAMLGSGSSIKRNGNPITGESEFAAAAYVFADAMLAERSK